MRSPWPWRRRASSSVGWEGIVNRKNMRKSKKSGQNSAPIKTKPAPDPVAEAATPPPPPKLSICIPTYNRAPFLDRVLTHLRDDAVLPFDFEIVVSDNASTDDTGNVVKRYADAGLQIRYLKQAANSGLEPNFCSAMRHARGEYTVYLADDDFLVFDKLIRVVECLDQNPGISAVYTPWVFWDDVDKAEGGQFFRLTGGSVFDAGKILELFDFIVDRHIFPEIAVYRTRALQAVLTPRTICYFFFAYLAHLLDHGAVAFLDEPFYRHVTRSALDRDRPQAGFEQVMTDWDIYRGGLDYLLNVGVRRAGAAIDEARGRAIQARVDQFVRVRMMVALRMWAWRGNYIRAFEIYNRLRLWTPDEDTVLRPLRAPVIALTAGEAHLTASLQQLALLQMVVEIANTTAAIQRLEVYIGAPFDAETWMRHLGLAPRMAIAVEGTPATPRTAEQTFVFYGANSGLDHAGLIALGYDPGLILSERMMWMNVPVR